MGYADILEALQGTGAAGVPSAATAAANKVPHETETWLVASSAGGALTITDGSIMVIDTQTLAGAPRVRVAKMSSATTDIPVGVALLNASVVIPQTTAAGDIMVPILVLRRGFHPAVRVTTGGAANNVVGCFATAAGQGAAPVATSALVAGVQEANIVGVSMAASASTLCPMWVCCQFG